MNLQAIRYLVALADCNHFGKAAAACFVSQPTLSMQIKKLEEELGTQLLERTNKSVMLTETGVLMVSHARRVLQEINAMHAQADAVRDPYGGQMRLGIIPTLAPYLLPLIISGMAQKFPRLKYYLQEAATVSLLEQLKSAAIDAAILALPILEKDLVVAPLFAEEFMLAVPSNHRLSRHKAVTERDLQEESLLLLEEGHCLREQALALCERMQISEVKDFRATSLETLRHMVAAGVGLTLMPELACVKSAALSYIPFGSKKPPCRQLGLVWRKTTPKQQLLTEMAALIKNILAKSNKAGK